MKRKKRVSILDIAKQASVSHQTVSRVINNKDGVSDETRERVLATARALGYSPNEIARSLVAGRSYTVGCISQNLADFALATIIEAFRKRVREDGYLALTGSGENETEAKELLDIFYRRRVDGLLVLDPGMDGRREYVLELVKRGFPVVYLGTTPQGEPVSYVNCDDFDCGYQATSYLIKLGHRRIATITGPQNEENAATRLKGYRHALQDAGILVEDGLVEVGNWFSSSGYDAVYRLAKKEIPFTAIFAQSDPIALGASCALRELGLRVPDRVSLIGSDDNPTVSYLDPPLTTLRLDMETLGREAGRLLIQHIQNPSKEPECVMVKTQLIERASCTPPQT